MENECPIPKIYEKTDQVLVLSLSYFHFYDQSSNFFQLQRYICDVKSEIELIILEEFSEALWFYYFESTH